MTEDNSILTKGLTKIYNSLYIKGIVDFTIEITKHKFDMEGNSIYINVLVDIINLQ